MAFWYNMSWPFSLNLHSFIWIWALDFLNCNAKFYIVDSIPFFFCFLKIWMSILSSKISVFLPLWRVFFFFFYLFLEDLILSMEVHCSDGPVTWISLFLSLTGIVGPHVFWGDHRTVSHLVMQRRVSDGVDLRSCPSLSPLLCAYQASPLTSPHHCCHSGPTAAYPLPLVPRQQALLSLPVPPVTSAALHHSRCYNPECSVAKSRVAISFEHQCSICHDVKQHFNRNCLIFSLWQCCPSNTKICVAYSH